MSSAAITSRRSVSTATGALRGRTTGASRPSGAARPANARPRACGSRHRACTVLIPRETLRWRGLYKRRSAVEREFGRLKGEWALTPLRVRGIERVRLHADLTILAKLSCVLARARAVPLAASGLASRQ